MEVEGTNAFCRVGKAPASGKTWSSIGSGRPAQGQELTSQDELASALATKTEFTQAEADVLLAGVNLDTESFVRSGNSYYVPTEALAFGTRGDFCDTSCKACPASKHSAQAGSLECDICPLNTYAAEPKTIHCSPCQIGQSTAGKTAATTCTPCASGTFNDEPGQDCRPCPTGSFSLYKAGEAHGASECIVCKGTNPSRCRCCAPAASITASSSCTQSNRSSTQIFRAASTSQHRPKTSASNALKIPRTVGLMGQILTIASAVLDSGTCWCSYHAPSFVMPGCS